MDDHEFKLTNKQLEIQEMFASAAKYMLVYGGSRSGKTFFTCYAILTRALMAPGSRHAIFRLTAVAAKQSIAKDTIPKVVSLAYPGLQLKWKEQDGYFLLPNGSEIWIGGLEDKDRVDKVLGREFSTIYINESSEISLTSYRVVMTRLAQRVRTMAGEWLALKCYVDLNPDNSEHWTYKIWIDGQDPDADDRDIPEHETNYAQITVNPMDNSENLAGDYIRDLANLPELQRRRFFEGLYTADNDNALWRRKDIKVVSPPDLKRIVVAIDPATTSNAGSDITGIIVAGIGVDQRAYVLADDSGKYRPEEFARRAVSLYDTYDADCIVAEVNQGGDMVDALVKAAAKGRVIPYRGVHASRGKHIRAEPIAALYEQGKVHHADEFTKLVDQMCAFTMDFDRKQQGYSPDRVDALVWALTDLFPGMTKRRKVDQGPVFIPRINRM
jgi:predicted phage terminase large subunit-like protein